MESPWLIMELPMSLICIFCGNPVGGKGWWLVLTVLVSLVASHYSVVKF